jgi:hypothetical protein
MSCSKARDIPSCESCGIPELVPEGDSTNVSWAMHGPNTFIGRIMRLFVDMDRMIGKDFEIGLAKLKTVAEK